MPAEGTRGRDDVRSRGSCLLYSKIVYPFTFPDIHPEMTAAAAAAEALAPRIFHLPGSNGRNRIQHISGRLIDVLIPPEVAGIVIHDNLAADLMGNKFFLQQLRFEELGVMHHMVTAPELGVLIFQHL